MMEIMKMSLHKLEAFVFYSSCYIEILSILIDMQSDEAIKDSGIEKVIIMEENEFRLNFSSSVVQGKIHMMELHLITLIMKQATCTLVQRKG